MKVKDLVPGVWDAAPIKIRNMFSSKDLSNALSSKVIAPDCHSQKFFCR